MFQLISRFRRNHFLRHMGPSAGPCLHTRERLHAQITAERARADGNGRSFSLVSFQLPRSAAEQPNLLKLAHFALGRSRATDDVGWFDAHTIASLLPETNTQGAWVYAQGVADAVQAKLGVFPEVKVYAYPANWVKRDQREESRCPAVRRPKVVAPAPADERLPQPLTA